MTATATLTVTEGLDQFYPTPANLADKMFADIDWEAVDSILEPSAGKGGLVYAALKSFANNSSTDRRHRAGLNIDVIEIDPYLRAIIKENYNSEWKKPLKARVKELENEPYDSLFYNDRRDAELFIRAIDNSKVNVIHDNFLTYRGFGKYQLIAMNPPFAEGALHLLKAIEIQKNGGSIVCLLNAETIRNPYTNSRKVLAQQLDKYDAEVSYVSSAFRNAERRTDVEVAIVRINIPVETELHSDIWERMEKAESEMPGDDYEATELVAGDYIEQAVALFNVEVNASFELIRQYEALRPYILTSLNPNRAYNNSILTLSVGSDSNYKQNVDINEYLQVVRSKYWCFLFSNEQFVGKLTSKLREEWMNTVDSMKNYDFTLFNIKTVMHEMNSQIVDGIKSSILSLFDKLTAEHSYYPEFQQNIHLYNGWKTNKAHKIGKKTIIPIYGMFSSSSWKRDTFDTYEAYRVIVDIEKVFDYLNGTINEESFLRYYLNNANADNQTRNIRLKYFDIDLYKKGTMHIRFRDMELIEKFNIYAARNRDWLPPSYGKVKYSEMTTEEQEVIDSFQGEEAYEKVLARSDYYLSEPTNSMAMLTDGS
jgi:hypothetical protein